MNKHRLHHVWTIFRVIKPRYLFILVILSGAICVTALRANNEHMVKLRNAVYAADKAGTDVQQPLRNLQSYVTGHMNTNLAAGSNAVYPPIQLKYTYDRLIHAQSDKLTAGNSLLYNQAQAYCEQQNPVDFSGHNRVPCIEQYVTSHNQAQLPQIPDALYKFSFVSPQWSPDLAGWSLLTTAILGVAFIFSLIAHWWFKRHVA